MSERLGPWTPMAMRVKELTADLDRLRKNWMPPEQYADMAAENELLCEALDRIEGEPEDPLKVQAIARKALNAKQGDWMTVTRTKCGTCGGDAVEMSGGELVTANQREHTEAVVRLAEAESILRDVARTRRSEAWGMVQMAAQAFLDASTPAISRTQNTTEDS